MERIPERQRLVPAGGVTGEFQRHGNRSGAARGEQNLVEVARRGLNEAPRERRRGRIGETARAEGQGFHFAADRGDDLWVAVAELMDAVAVKIEDAPAVDVGQNRAFGAHDRRETGRRQRLAEEIALVLVERGARGIAERGAPFRSRGRNIDVALDRRRTGFVHGRSPRASRSSIVAHDWHQVGDAVDDIVRARALELVHRRLAPLCEVIRSKRRRVLARQAETIAADGYADRPRAAVDPLGDSDLRVVDLDHAPGGPNLEVEQRLVKHEGRRPSVRRVAGANETVRLEPLRRRDRQDLGHDLAGVAGRRADLDPLASELGDDLRGAGNESRVARRHRDVLRHEGGVDGVDVRLVGACP